MTARRLGYAIALPAGLIVASALAEPRRTDVWARKVQARLLTGSAAAAKAPRSERARQSGKVQSPPAEAPMLPMPAGVRAKPADPPATAIGHSFRFGDVTVTPGGYVGLDGISR